MSLLVMYSCRVLLQRGLLTEPHLTSGALITLDLFMHNLDVIVQLVLDGKGFATLITAKWSGVGMSPQPVLLERVQQCECFLAQLTLVGPQFQMHAPDMSGQSVGTSKELATLLALNVFSAFMNA
jgi:hypothetical protein